MSTVSAEEVEISTIDTEDTGPQHCDHSHCHKCGAEAHGWCEETRTWSCDRCSAAEDHKRLADWFLKNCDDEIKEGSLADNVIRILAELKVSPSLLKKKDGHTQFSIWCVMKDRWVPHFLAALKYMQQLGNLGGSRMVSLYADGDGDFQPKFVWADDLPSDAAAVKDEDGNMTFDAG